MGESPKITDPLLALEQARRQFEEADDFTIAVEEEFAILDPETLEMTGGFEQLAAAGAEHPALEGMIAGELILSEIEVKTGKCDSFSEAVNAMARRRIDLSDVAERVGYRLCAAGTHPWSRWQDQRIIDTPHYQIVESTLRYVAWRNNTFGLHVHVAIRGADRAIAVNSALRTVLPELLAFSGSSPWMEGRHTHLHSTRTEIFTRMFPRCGIPDSFADWDEYAGFVRFLVETRSIKEHTEIWWSVRPHQAYPTVETRICDGQPEFARAAGLAGLMVALTADFARRFDAGERLPEYPGRDLEENLWRAIRWGMSGELIDLAARRSIPARERLEQMIEQVSDTAAELGITPHLDALRGPTLSEQAGELMAAGADPRELWPDAVERTRESAREWINQRQEA
ncbi:MAG: glutamate---cysteine ligase / carboxylate-amine ligase [Gaiellales bacterium]|nr:glutamate---cysteine ligase / carboxylate-amine ligase [Gaiellales bacterium]